VECLTYFKLYPGHTFKSSSNTNDSQTVEETEENYQSGLRGKEKDILVAATNLQQLNFHSVRNSDNLL